MAPVSENDAESSAKQVKNLPAVANIPPKGVHFSRSYPFYFLIGAVIVAAFVIGVFFFNPDSPQDSLTAMNVTKENEQPYDNISLYRVSKNTQSTRQTAYNIPERLKSSLERINELLEKNNATLDAYYRASDPILHYTFSIKTSCEHKELSMNIFHWRINNDRLNDLVLREIERKLNELSRAIAKATVLALFMVISVSFIARTHANGPPNESDIAVVEDLDLKSQMGFYDLLSEQEEVYDVRMFPGNNSFLISITTPSDSRFIMKGDMKLEKNNSGGTDFKFLPIYYNSPQKNRLIDSLIDGTTNRIMLLNSFQNERIRSLFHRMVWFLFTRKAPSWSTRLRCLKALKQQPNR
ncbi:hypothetical protein [Budvicia aquatica]|uniref:Uncharacterized protein n=1 Tax=Budvicia aquatica TaxID=82979 RepID=A0A484ZJL3_9GAMM|nr:hypothetical protein [Budvicia aquatica]VFS47911.1 Uncharacterised protein [Budvicia aquatica]